MTNDEMLIRQAIAAEAEQAVDPGIVTAELRRGRRPRRRRATTIAAVAGLAVAAGIVAVVVPLTASREQTPPAASESVVPPPALNGQTVLLLGLDSIDLADSIVLARFGSDGSFRAVSVPRDTRVDEQATRLNSVYVRAGGGRTGAEATVDAVRRITGITADHYATIDMAGFAAMTSALGGVEVCLANATKDVLANADFPAGSQTLSGDQALAFIRQRHGLPNGDLDRIVRHQAFLRALITKVRSTDVLRDPRKTAEVVAVLRRSVRSDPDLRLIDLARGLAKQSSVALATVPWTGPDKQNTLVVDPAEAQRFTAEFFAGQPTGTAPSAPDGTSGSSCVN